MLPRPTLPGAHERTPMSILATKEISMSKVSSIENPVEVGGEYRGQVLRVEPHGIEQVSASERHGRPRTLFTLWLSANMGLPVWLVGALAIVFGLGFADGVIAILVGNIVDFFLHPGQLMRPNGLPTSFRRAIEWPA